MSDSADQPGGEPSKTRLDKLGDRLRAGSSEEADRRALDSYRRSFRPAYDEVAEYLSGSGIVEYTGRPAKTTTAIIEKLNRQKVRLTQIQDIAGLRVVVDGIGEQDRRVSEIRVAFPRIAVDDRRLIPSHGYRAVHAIVPTLHRNVEIQIRTREQHLWAELSEKLSDVIDPAIKYGGGPSSTRATLLAYSQLVARIEGLEVATNSSALNLDQFEIRYERLPANDPDWQVTTEQLAQLRASQDEAEKATLEAKKMLAGLLTDYYNHLRQKP